MEQSEMYIVKVGELYIHNRTFKEMDSLKYCIENTSIDITFTKNMTEIAYFDYDTATFFANNLNGKVINVNLVFESEE